MIAPKDLFLGINDLVKMYGYYAIEHKVKTDDGYILTIYNIKAIADEHYNAGRSTWKGATEETR